MKQQDLNLNLNTRRTRKAQFLDEMERVVPWADLVLLIAEAAPAKKTGRPPFAHEIMLRLHFMQQWFGLSDMGMEEALLDTPLYREFAGLSRHGRLPDRVTILRFRHLLEKHHLAEKILATVNKMLTTQGLLLKQGTAIDATLIAAPSSTKNGTSSRDSEMHQTKKGNQWHFGMKAHIGVDAESGLVHSVSATPANAHDLSQAKELLHGEETDVFADAGYRGVEKRPDICERGHQPHWHVAMMPSKRKALDLGRESHKLTEQVEKLKAGIRAKVEHPFQVIKCQFGFRKVKYKGLAKNAANVVMLFALSNLWMARKALMRFLQPQG